MIIQFECPECHKTLRVKEQYSGKRARCVHCGQRVWIPRTQEQVKDLTVDRSAPRARYKAAESAETFEITCEACGTIIHVARQDSGTRIQCTNDECLGMILVAPPAAKARTNISKGTERAAPTFTKPPGATEQACQRIGGLVRAGYTFVYLVTWEEDRWDSKLSELALGTGRGLVTWSVTEGARPRLGDGQSLGGAREFLDQIDLYPSEHVFLVRDFHPYLSDPFIVR